MKELISINGKILPPEEAFVSVYDRGFLFGDAVYEVTRSYGKIFFQLEAHLDRLFRSAEAIDMNLGISKSQFIEDMYNLARQAGGENVYIRVQVSRGSNGIAILPTPELRATRVMYLRKLATVDPSLYQTGAPIWVSALWRNSKKATDPNIKSGNYMNNILALMDGSKHKPHETLLVNSQGSITEGATSNIFMVKQGVVITPPDSYDLLWGITRSIVRELIKKNGLKLDERGFTLEELQNCDEAFLTSSVREILPVSTVNNKTLKKSVGEITRQLHSDYKKVIEEYCEMGLKNHPWRSQ